ncbi:MAG: hypothetical protein ABSB71_09980 [Candidatus Bathyarchaeia archaeon]|jgi:hypothetical protein
MPKKIIFEELGKEERILLLKAFDYDVDEEGFIIDPHGSRIPSKEMPSQFLRIEDSMLIPGSLEVADATPTAIAKFIREKVEVAESTC